VILGIDPGLSGALALYDPATDRLDVRDVPTLLLTRNAKNKREVDVQALVDLILWMAKLRPTVFIENSTPMPGGGLASTFSFGKTFGLLYGVCAANKLVIERVSPMAWKKLLAVPKDKDGARARASVLLPRHSSNWPLKKHDGRAEAALIALYGYRVTPAPRRQDDYDLPLIETAGVDVIVKAVE
jgi:crossover junction endodeoxyribonuclease RuvC